MLITHHKHMNIKNEFDYDYTIALVGNPNVGKSTVFNALTGLHQHTGNWSGKTVSISYGFTNIDNKTIKVVDLPGTYSLESNSPDEIVTAELFETSDYDCIIIVVDSTSLERNLLLGLQVLSKTSKALVCLNLCDEAEKIGIDIDTDELSLSLGVPVVRTSARNRKGINKLLYTAIDICSNRLRTFTVKEIECLNETDTNNSKAEKISKLSYKISASVVGKKGEVYRNLDRTLDKLFTSKITGIPIMILIFAVIFWLTVYVANIPGEYLSVFFEFIKNQLNELCILIQLPAELRSFIVDGIFTTVSWVITVMLPPAAIFFPLFSLLEDSGYLPRIAFNLDRIFRGAGVSGKQALTMLMGFGCNACGVMGCRIIPSKKERLTAMLTNCFVPCNGRLPTLISLTSIFIATGYSKVKGAFTTTGVLLLLLFISVAITLLISYILSKVSGVKQSASFVMELPPYRKPQFIKSIVLSFKEKVLYVLSRAVLVAIPAGAIIWLITNIGTQDKSILAQASETLTPLGVVLGVDGVVLIAYFLAFPANEIFIPVMVMAYTSQSILTDISTNELASLLYDNNWTLLTAVCTCILCLLHFPCSTTMITIKRETNSFKDTALSFIIPITTGFLLCFLINLIVRLLNQVHTFS